MKNPPLVCPASPTIPRTMLEILYTMEPDGEVQNMECYPISTTANMPTSTCLIKATRLWEKPNGTRLYPLPEDQS